MIRRLGAQPVRAQAALCLALSVLLGVVAWRSVLAPAFQQVHTTRERLETVRAEAVRAAAIAARLPDVERRRVQLQRAVEVRGASTTVTVDETTALQAVPALAAAAGLPVQRFSPRAVRHEPHGTGWPVELSLRGDLSAIHRFLDGVAVYPGLLAIDAFHLRAEEVDGQALIEISCVISFVRLGASS